MKTYELILTVLLSLLLHAGKQTAIVEAAYMWEVGVFDDSCSATCGDGFGYRSVHCIDDSTNARVHDSMCEGDDSVATPKPSSQQYCTSTTTCGVEIDNEEAEVCPKFELWLDLAFDYRQYYPTDDELSIAMDGMLSHVLQTISNRVVVDIVYLVSANNRKVRTRDYSTPVTQTTTKIALLPRRTPTYEGEKGCNATIATLTSVLDASLLPASTEYEKEFCEGCAIPGNFKSTKVSV